MAYEEFIPTIWTETFQRELEKKLVFAEVCNRKYEGDISKMGDTVRILGTADPTVKTVTDKKIILEDPEDVADLSTSLVVDHISYYNFGVDDISKRQAPGGLMETLMKGAAYRVANEMDAFIASMANEAIAKTYAPTAVKLTKSNVMDEIDKALTMLYEQNVAPDGDIVMELPPWMFIMLRQANAVLNTNNSGLIERGNMGMYGNVRIKMTNNVFNNGTEWKVMVHTPDAIAFADQLQKTEAYRPEKTFEDAVKGFSLYGAKIVRPAELVVMNVKK